MPATCIVQYGQLDKHGHYLLLVSGHTSNYKVREDVFVYV